MSWSYSQDLSMDLELFPWLMIFVVLRDIMQVNLAFIVHFLLNIYAEKYQSHVHSLHDKNRLEGSVNSFECTALALRFSALT